MTKRSRKQPRVVATEQLAAVVGGVEGSDSRNIEFELIKFDMQKLTTTTPPKPAT